MKTTNLFPQRSKRNQRRDGLSTRNAILEVAGQVFAERGFAEATSKEICERAGANTAAVNYYFGGKESLYEEVLVTAHSQLLRLEDLDTIITSAAEPEEKLRAFLERMLKTAFASSELWGIKVFLRELFSPSPFISKAMAATVLPKAAKLRVLIQEITGLPQDSAQLQRAAVFVVIPCISLIMFPDTMRAAIAPATTDDPQSMLDELLIYALGGLRALGKNGSNTCK